MPVLTAAESDWVLAELALDAVHWCDRLLSGNPVYWQRSEGQGGKQ